MNTLIDDVIIYSLIVGVFRPGSGKPPLQQLWNMLSTNDCLC